MTTTLLDDKIRQNGGKRWNSSVDQKNESRINDQNLTADDDQYGIRGWISETLVFGFIKMTRVAHESSTVTSELVLRWDFVTWYFVFEEILLFRLFDST